MRVDILKNIEDMLSQITERPQSISEDTVLYGIAENKLDACSLELASWFTEIEFRYDIELPMDIVSVADIVDQVVERGKVNEF